MRMVKKKRCVISDAARLGGLFAVGPSGVGKSRLVGRRVCYQDLRRGIAQVVIDPVGETINNLLDKVLYLPREEQLEVGERIRYCPMFGYEGYVVSWPPLVKRHPQESLDAVAQRLIDVIVKTDRNLKTASIQGFNRLAPLLTSVAIVLTALREPITAAFDLLDNPRAWQERLSVAASIIEAREAVTRLQKHFALPQKVQEERTELLRSKLSHLEFNRAMRAMSSGATPTIDWEEVTYKDNLTILLDFGHQSVGSNLREWQLFTVWEELLSFIKTRSRSDPALGLVIDELSFLVNSANLNRDVITADFETLITAFKRNKRLFVTACTQSEKQLPEKMLMSCLSMGNLLFGVTVDTESAMDRARWFDYLNPFRIKNTEYHKGVIPLALEGGKVDQFTPRYYGVTGKNTQYMPQSETQYVESLKYKNILKEEWFFGQSRYEGDVPRTLRRITTRDLDPGQYVNEKLVSSLKRNLMRRDGVKIEEVLAELDESVEAAREKCSQDESLDENAVEEKIKPKLLDRAREALGGNRPRRAGRRRYVEPE